MQYVELRLDAHVTFNEYVLQHITFLIINWLVN